jgi:hypothetical protein
MEIKRREQIYDRLSEMSMRMENRVIPDPRYINEKLGQCHISIEEVEKFYIEISKEIAAVQRAYNNALAGYENAVDVLIATDPEIMALPSLRDREAKSNLQLKKELSEIKAYKNDLADLEYLQKAVNVKLRNLSRLNMDIKVQMRLMDSQIRLGSPSVENASVRNLMEEIKKSTVGLDVFNESETKMEKITTVDPTEPLNVENLFEPVIPSDLLVKIPTEEPVVETPKENSVTNELLSQELVEIPTEEPVTEILTEEPVTEILTEEPVTEILTEEPVVESPRENSVPIINDLLLKNSTEESPVTEDPVLIDLSDVLTMPLNKGLLIQEKVEPPEKESPPSEENEEKPEERSITDRLLNPLPTDPVDDLSSCMPEAGIDGDIHETTIDLDKILSPEVSTPKIGGNVEETKISTESKQKEILKPKIPSEIDFESLLSQFK